MSIPVKIAYVLAGLLALTDVASLFGDNGPEPTAVVIAGGALGLLTFAGIAFGVRGRAAGVWTVIVTRTLSALSALPAFGADVPVGVKIAVAAGLLLTAFVVVTLWRAERPSAAEAGTV